MSRVREQTTKNWNDGGGLGFNPKMATKKFEGLGEGPDDKRRYEKGYSRMMGTCEKCEHYKGKDAKQGEHCNLKECDK